jgi:hypothetical protein
MTFLPWLKRLRRPPAAPRVQRTLFEPAPIWRFDPRVRPQDPFSIYRDVPGVTKENMR